MGKLIYEELTFQIRKSLFNVYNQLGPGYREETYKQAMIRDFNLEGIPYCREKTFPVRYRDELVDEYRVDLIAFDRIVLELKAVAEMHSRFEAQLLSYLKLTGLKLGLLVNFGSDKLEIRRFVNPHITSASRRKYFDRC